MSGYCSFCDVWHSGSCCHPGLGAQRTLRAELTRLQSENERLSREVSMHRRPEDIPRDPPSVLATLGFWPDCGCGECYAIHCLDEAMGNVRRLSSELDAVRQDAGRYEWFRRHYSALMCTSSRGGQSVEFMTVLLSAIFKPEMLDTAIDARMQETPSGDKP